MSTLSMIFVVSGMTALARGVMSIIDWMER